MCQASRRLRRSKQFLPFRPERLPRRRIRGQTVEVFFPNARLPRSESAIEWWWHIWGPFGKKGKHDRYIDIHPSDIDMSRYTHTHTSLESLSTWNNKGLGDHRKGACIVATTGRRMNNKNNMMMNKKNTMINMMTMMTMTRMAIVMMMMMMMMIIMRMTLVTMAMTVTTVSA